MQQIEVPLDFSIDSDFPVKISLGGEEDDNAVPTLTVEWGFKLGFGFDEEEGFFLQTFPDDDSEFCVQALLDIRNQSVDASLFFLDANLSDIDLLVGAGIFVNLKKESALRLSENEAPGQAVRSTVSF